MMERGCTVAQVFLCFCFILLFLQLHGFFIDQEFHIYEFKKYLIHY